MNVNKRQSLVSHLREYGINDTMIQIVQKERMTDDDIQSINRDDVDHLFKVENGFTFRDRKQFWQFVQKFQSSSTTMNIDNEVLCIELDVDSPEILEQIYEFGEEKPQSPGSIQRCTSSSSSHVNQQVDANKLYEFHDEEEEETATSSLPSFEGVPQQAQLTSSSDYVFLYPTLLPTFSASITEALKTNGIHRYWNNFINELARWIMSIKPSIRDQHEYRAIGQTLYEKYPCLGTAGPKPWSLLCRSLSQKIRSERWQRQKTLTAKRKEKAKQKQDQIYNLSSKILP